MMPHQQRVVDEKTDLDVKIEKLEAFIEGEIFSSLSDEEKDRLNLQLVTMDKYSDILGERIAAFPAPELTIVP